MSLKKGDYVSVYDFSFIERVDSWESNVYINDTEDTVFKILEIKPLNFLRTVNDSERPIHDVYIQDTKTKKIYLHSLYLCKKKMFRTAKKSHEIVKWLEDHNWECQDDGWKSHCVTDYPAFFNFRMLQECGKNIEESDYKWKDEWVDYN
jgi:hypothetical protein